MAEPEISFALVLSKNLGLPKTQLKQIEAVITVSGSTDPLTLQKMRDAVDSSYKKARNGLNALIEEQEKVLAGAPTKKQYENRVNAFHKLMDDRLGAIESDLQSKLTAFCKKDKELKAIYAKNKKLFRTQATWSGAKILNASLKAFTEGTAGALAGGLNPQTLKAVKTCFDISSDLVSLGKEVKAYYTSEEKQRKIFKAALLEITAIDDTEPIPASLISALEDALKPYPQKLLDIEMNANEAAAKLEKLLDASAALSKVDDPGVQEQAKKGATAVEATIEEITETHKRVQSGKAFLAYTEKQLESAKTRSQDDQGWISWGLSWATELNSRYNDFDAVTGSPDTYIDQIDRVYTAYTSCMELVEKLKGE